MSFRIGKRTVGEGRCFIIGEVGLAHDGSLQAAHAAIDALAWARVDAVKLQCHMADHEQDKPLRVPGYQDKTRHDQWRRTSFTKQQWEVLHVHADVAGLEFLCSPFSVEAVKLLDPLVPAWKVPSGEITNVPLLVACRETGKPILISTGMATKNEIADAIAYTKRWVPVQILECTSEYPTPPEHSRIVNASVHRGMSDHSGTIYAGLAAAAGGLDVLEVHVKLSDWDQGPDASSSLTPEKLKELVEGVRWIERAKAHPVDKDEMAKELAPMRALFMKQPVNA